MWPEVLSLADSILSTFGIVMEADESGSTIIIEPKEKSLKFKKKIFRYNLLSGFRESFLL